MLEELKFKKREEMKYRILCTIITILALGLMLILSKSVSVVMCTIDYDDVGKMLGIMLINVDVLANIGVFECWRYFCHVAGESKKRNVSEFEFNAKIDNLLKELGDKGEMQVSFEVVSDDFSPEFREVILNPDLTFYVRKKAPKEVELLIYEENKEISSWDLDYEFLFKHFRPIYGAKKERE